MIFGFCGGTGAGKSTLVEYAAQFLGEHNTLVLGQDHYYKHLPNLTYEQRCEINFDHPDALDFELMTSDLQKLKQGVSIKRPMYSFAEHLRMNETVTIHPKEFILVEGILLFEHEPLHSLFDCKVFIEAGEKIRVRRRLERDVRQRGRTKEEVHERFKTTLHTMHHLYIAPNKEIADIVIQNNGVIEDAAGALRKWLKNTIQ